MAKRERPNALSQINDKLNGRENPPRYSHDVCKCEKQQITERNRELRGGSTLENATLINIGVAICKKYRSMPFLRLFSCLSKKKTSLKFLKGNILCSEIGYQTRRPTYKGKERQSNPIRGLERPRVFQEAEGPRFQNNRHRKVVRLSVLRTGLLYPKEIFLVLISVRG